MATARRVMNCYSQTLLLCFIQLPQGIENQVGVAERLDARGKTFGSFLRLKTAGGDLNYASEAELGEVSGRFSVDNFSVVEECLPGLSVVEEGKRSGQ